MGHATYSVDNRSLRSATEGYTTKTVNQIFEQNVKRRMHELMDPKGVKFRESRDSAAHPLTVPIQFWLDVTGSMGSIPHQMIKDGLPKLMGNLIQNGVKDASLMFGAIGDHETDNCPMQIAQFESGDAELDMWLTRTYLEGNGGGNAGESYLLAWYFAANHIKTDAWEKRQKKGYVITIGDEPCLRNLPVSAVKAIMGDTAVGQGNYTMEELLAAAQRENHVYHIHMEHGGRSVPSMWKELLGDHLIVITDHNEVAKVISDIVLKNEGVTAVVAPVSNPADQSML